MGKYINGIGTSFDEKVSNLKSKHNGIVTSGNSFEDNLVCVVDNGMFAAVAYCLMNWNLMSLSKQIVENVG